MAAIRTPLLAGVLSKLGRLNISSSSSHLITRPVSSSFSSSSHLITRPVSSSSSSSPLITRSVSSSFSSHLITRPVSSSHLMTRPARPGPASVLPAAGHVRLAPSCSSLHTSTTRCGLMEFFDDPKHWGEMEVKVGRSWRKEELRLKSNEDLHKLWFVLLKEKNMLLTMEHACDEEYQIFPNPERIDKVEDSMSNLEEVVKERNRAYWLLETGHNGERNGEVEMDELGRRVYRKFTEHTVPYWMTSRPWRVTDIKANLKFSRLMREKKCREKRKARNRIRNHVCMLLRRFPHMDMEVLQQKYPEVNVKTLQLRKRSLGHHSYNLA